MTRHVPLQAAPRRTCATGRGAITLPDPFVHLHVASGYSLQYGASHPHVLVERAAEQEMDTLALTDRDGAYGAVRFAKACLQGGVRPVLGVDLAVAPILHAARPGGQPAGRPTRSRRPRARPDPGARRGVPRRPAAPGDVPGRQPAGLGRAVPAGLGHPPGRRARRAGEHPRPGRRARLARSTRGRAGAARPRLRARPGRDAAPRRPRPGRAARPGWRSSTAPTCSSRWSPTGCPGPGPGRSPHAARMAGARPVDRAGRGAHQRGPLRRPGRRPDGRRARRRPAAGPARPARTSTGATPRASSSPASRWPRWPRRSAGSPGSGRQRRGRPGGCSPAPARSPTGARSTRAPTSASARCTSPSSSCGRRGGSGPGTTADGVLRARCEAAVGRPLRQRTRGSGSGSGSTTSCGSSAASATRRTSSPSPTSPT